MTEPNKPAEPQKPEPPKPPQPPPSKAEDDAKKDVKKVESEIEKSKTQQDKKREELLEKIGAILKDYGQESNIPVDHEYWQLTGQYRALKG